MHELARMFQFRQGDVRGVGLGVLHVPSERPDPVKKFFGPMAERGNRCHFQGIDLRPQAGRRTAKIGYAGGRADARACQRHGLP